MKVGHDIYKVPKPSDPEDEAGKVFRRINNKQVERTDSLVYEINIVWQAVIKGRNPEHYTLYFL